MLNKIQWEDHRILGNLYLDFTKLDGNPFTTIVFAGENGTGKTTILDCIASLFSRDACSYDHISSFSYDDEKVTIAPNGPNSWRVSNKETSKETVGLIIFPDPKPSLKGCLFSGARSGFTRGAISSITTSKLDSNKIDNDEQGGDEGIKQLLANLQTQDNSDLSSYIYQNKPIPDRNALLAGTRIYRFRHAFDNFFDGDISFDHVDSENAGNIQILFDKNGKSVPIDDLSTGEKQIVFRGGRLLSNKNALAGGLVLIDEPELSLHPLWQEKILEFYQDIFSEGGAQKNQLFIATHSEYVVKNALEHPDDVLVIVLKRNSTGNIEPEAIKTPYALGSITAAETNYLAFHVISTDYHIELYSRLQELIGQPSIGRCDTFIKAQPECTGNYLYFSSNPHNGATYDTLPTYIRNCIDHPDSCNTYTPQQLEDSTSLLIRLCKRLSQPVQAH